MGHVRHLDAPPLLEDSTREIHGGGDSGSGLTRGRRQRFHSWAAGRGISGARQRRLAALHCRRQCRRRWRRRCAADIFLSSFLFFFRCVGTGRLGSENGASFRCHQNSKYFYTLHYINF
jgi:hypothetical protein